MGEVWRARDPRLGREVAIKVLPEEVSSDRERVGRFEREARAASALNHPNIVTIHEVGEAQGRAYLVMERIEGQTLREILQEGPLPMRRLLSIAAQAADGLARAHESGIVHRDLKPENLMVTKDGFVKILDFGLAKLVELRNVRGRSHGSADGHERHRGGNGSRDGRVHVAGAGERKAARSPLRPVLPRRDPLRDGDGPARVPEEHAGGDAHGDHSRGSRAGRNPESAGSRAFALGDRTMPRQEPGGPLRLDARPGARPREHAGPSLRGLDRG